MHLLRMLLRVGRIEDDVMCGIPMQYAIHNEFTRSQRFHCARAHIRGEQLQLLVIIMGQHEGQTGTITILERSRVQIHPASFRFHAVVLREGEI